MIYADGRLRYGELIIDNILVDKENQSLSLKTTSKKLSPLLEIKRQFKRHWSVDYRLKWNKLFSNERRKK
jgi:hypothetical protein